MRKSTGVKTEREGDYFEGLGWVVPKRSNQMRAFYKRQYGHHHIVGKRAGKQIYLRKAVYNFWMDYLKMQEKKLGVPYRFSYEELASLIAMKRGPRKVR